MTIHIRATEFQPSTLDPDARTVEAIASTGADTRRPGYIERLDMQGCDVATLIGGPLLDGHRSEVTQDQLGIVEDARVTPDGLWVRLKFRDSPAAMDVMASVADGTLRGLSIGYSVEEWSDTAQENQRIRTAKKWTPVEVSNRNTCRVRSRRRSNQGTVGLWCWLDRSPWLVPGRLMSIAVSELEQLRDSLIRARAKGVRSAQFNGERVEYRDDAEMAKATRHVAKHHAARCLGL